MKHRRRILPVRGAALAVLIVSAAAAQTAPEKPFVERVEVNVRTILVRITDKDGRAPSPPPEPADLAVFEDGVAVKILGVDPAAAGPPPSALTPAPGESGPAPVPVPEVLPPPSSVGIPQHLYVDATLLEAASVSRLAAAFAKNLPQILANGSLEIVVADPEPRQILAATRDEQLAREALARLSSTVSGKQTLQFSRKRTMDTLRNEFCTTSESSQSTIRNAAEQELRIAQGSLDRLLRWATSLGGQRPDVVYFVSDGFDSDPSESYRKVVIQKSAQPQTTLCEGINPQQAEVLSAQLRQEFAPQGATMVGRAAQSLAVLGVEAVPIALEGNSRDFGGDASTSGQDAFASTSGTVPLLSRPMDPLRVLADTTGGEIMTSVSTFSAAVDAYQSTYVVSFRTDHPPDGRPHPLRIESRRPDLTVRGPKFAGGTGFGAVATGQTVRALNEPPPAGAFPVRVSVDGVAKSGKDFTGMLQVDADLSSMVSTLDLLGGGRIRLTIAVDVAAREPFTTREEFDVGKKSALRFNVPLRWPAKGRRVAVTVEELKTGARGTGAAELPGS
jgi:hypothetical protein